MRRLKKTMFGAAVAARVAVATLLPVSQALALSGGVKLPDPYVSRALDAVLIPIDDGVRTAFKLSPKDSGVLVLAVQPDGVADKQGIQAGDVISQIHGHKVAKPIDVDTVVYYWIKQKNDDTFLIDYYRNGTVYNTTSTITLALFSLAIDITTVSTWESWSMETSFTYAEFYSEYSVEMTESYTSSETTIEETATSETFAAEEAAEEKSDAKDTDGDGTPDAQDADDDNDGIPDAQDNDDDGDGVDDAAEGPASVDTDGDGTPDAEDTDDDNDGTPDAEDNDDDGDGVDDSAEDDGGDDDGGGDDGGGDDGDE